MKRASLAIVLALLLAACQHRHPLSDEALRRFEQGGAILVLDGDMTAFGCGAARYNFINLADGSEVSIKSEAGAGTGVGVAGRYRLKEVFCQVWGTGGWSIPVSGWFSPFEAKAGEVVYLGTFVVTPFGKTASGATLLQTPEMQTDWGQVPTYVVKDDLEAARRVLRPEIGDRADRMISRLSEVKITEQDFAAMVRRGYQADSSGQTPTRGQAKDSVRLELAKARGTED